jgi:hypothetical protein
MLNTSELSRITKELMLGLPPTLTTPEAMEAREAIAKDLAQMRKDGIAPDLPYDFDELPELVPPAPPPTDAEIQASKLNLIRSNLASGMAVARRMEAEEREIADEQDQCCLALEARIAALAPLNPTTQAQFSAEIATLTQQPAEGNHFPQLSPSHARKLGRILREASESAPPRPRRKPRRKP